MVEVSGPGSSQTFDRSSTSEFRFGHLLLEAFTVDVARDWILTRARQGRAATVVTSNIQHLRLAETDSAFRAMVSRCDLNVADGWPLVAASRIFGPRLPERVGGIDLISSVLKSAAPLRIAILGGPPGAPAALAARVGPQHDVVMLEPLEKGRWDLDDLGNVRERLAIAQANLVLVGIGAPKQELLAERLADVSCGPIVGCGAAIEVLSGQRRRAPAFLRRVGMEWAFRLALEPRRLVSRYITSVYYLTRVCLRELSVRTDDDGGG